MEILPNKPVMEIILNKPGMKNVEISLNKPGMKNLENIAYPAFCLSAIMIEKQSLIRQ